MDSENRRRFLNQTAVILGGVVVGGCGGDDHSASAAGTPAVPSSATPDGRSSYVAAQVLNKDWQLQPAAKVTDSPLAISTAGYTAREWMKAVVPGTVLTSMVQNELYPEPLFGANLDQIPDTLCLDSYWYRCEFDNLAAVDGKNIWLKFDGINYIASLWVNGRAAGTLEGAFQHGYFNITSLVGNAPKTAIAIRIDPPPHPGDKHTFGPQGGGPNGGILLMDSPTFVCSIGWDWVQTIPDRNIGIWQPVTLFSTGAVRIDDVHVTAVPSVPDLGTATIKLQITLTNHSSTHQRGTLDGAIDDIRFSVPVSIKASSTTTVQLDPESLPALSISNPRLWWPNGYGSPELYGLKVQFSSTDGVVHDQKNTRFGIRKIEYFQPGKSNLSLSVNGVPIFIKGGSWGMDESLKRIPRSRLEVQVRMQKEANYNMVRNWVGQSTSEDFYDLCDQYGLMVWNEFWSSTEFNQVGVNQSRYMDNVRDTLIHYRNHPSIALWCGGNEGPPPTHITDNTKNLMSRLDPTRLYLEASGGTRQADAYGFTSGGPYDWRTPSFYFDNADPAQDGNLVPFRNEIGAESIPTLESIQAMLPQQSWEAMDSVWWQHNLRAQYLPLIVSRYGAMRNLADFVRKSQLANYEAHKAIYEARLANMFEPNTGVLLWMSNPTQPCFVWQLFTYDLEQHSTFFAIRNACEPVHVQMNMSNRSVVVVNQTTTPVSGHVRVRVFDLQGTMLNDTALSVAPVPGSRRLMIGTADLGAAPAAVCFVSLQFFEDASPQPRSENFYWVDTAGPDADYTALSTMPAAQVDVNASMGASAYVATPGSPQQDSVTINVSVRNPSSAVALMVHLQLRDAAGKNRILPAYFSNNYLSLPPGASTTLTIDVPGGSQHAGFSLAADGWNLALTPASASSPIPVMLNTAAMPELQAATNFG
jgi:mannosylglycoprotein endo-beta-mannosidase